MRFAYPSVRCDLPGHVTFVEVVTGQTVASPPEARGEPRWATGSPSGGGGDPLGIAGLVFAAPVIILVAHGTEMEIPLAARVQLI